MNMIHVWIENPAVKPHGEILVIQKMAFLPLSLHVLPLLLLSLHSVLLHLEDQSLLSLVLTHTYLTFPQLWLGGAIQFRGLQKT